MTRFLVRALAAVALAAVCGLPAQAQAQPQLVRYDFSGQQQNATTVPPTFIAAGLDASPLRGDGVNNRPVILFRPDGVGTISNSFVGSGFSTTTVANAGYYSFSITPKVDGVLNFTSANLLFSGNSESQGPINFQLFSTFTGFTTPIGTIAVTPADANYAIPLTTLMPQTVTQGTAYEFRLAGAGAGSSSGVFDLNDRSTGGGLELGGTFTPVPEPTFVLAACALVMGTVARVRSRRPVGC